MMLLGSFSEIGYLYKLKLTFWVVAALDTCKLGASSMPLGLAFVRAD
jgi:hypothetical protein